jgi:hypothetical protein
VARVTLEVISAVQYSDCGREPQPLALASKPRADEGARRLCYVPQSLRLSVGAIEITRKPAVNSSSQSRDSMTQTGSRCLVQVRWVGATTNVQPLLLAVGMTCT